MIRRLRFKMIAIMMGVLVLVFAIIFLTLNVFMQSSSIRQTEQLLRNVAEQDGLPLMPGGPEVMHEQPPDSIHLPDPEMMRAGRFFYVKLDAAGQEIETNYERMFDFTQEEALDFVDRALESGRENGTIENLQFLMADKDYGRIVVFAERSIQSLMLSQLMRVSVIVALISFAILFGFSLLLSKWAVRPVAAAFDRQRRFISDAGHELKTPLTIISANVDVLENEIGENVRITHIREQSNRMSGLIHDLLALAKADETGAKLTASEFNLSVAVMSATLEFESAAFEAGKRLQYDIEDGISYVGDQLKIRQLTAILIDNAIKHSGAEGALIRVSLARAGERCRLSVYNTGSDLPEGERGKIFDRFYRSDDSRSRETGGYGLGLSIAKSIVDAHKGRIGVSVSADGGIEFVVTLPG